MSSQGISRQNLMTRVDTNTSRFNRTPRNSSVFLGEAIILLSASYLSDGEQVSIYIITLVLSSPVLRDLWAHLFRSILMTDMWASCRTKSSPQPSNFFFFFFIFNNIYSINNQQSKILTNTTILTLLTIQYLEYNRLRYLLCLQCKDLQYSVLTTLPTHYSHYNALFTSSSN